MRVLWHSAIKDEKRAEQQNIRHLSHHREFAENVPEYEKRAG